MTAWRSSGRLRLLDFDIECRPLSWKGPDYVTREVTAIASQFIGEEDEPVVWLLGHLKLERLLQRFVKRYEQADIVVGHYIRSFDLPTINGALLECGRPPLRQKMAHDTKNDLVKFQGIGKSQKDLASYLGVDADKVDMTDAAWRKANRLRRDGLKQSYMRVHGDVVQNIQLRDALLEVGALGPPRLWRP